MLHIHFSNRFEALSALLSARLDERPATRRDDPFVADHIIVPSEAVRRRLVLDLATRHGVVANVRFGFLASWLWTQMAAVVPDVQNASPFAAPVLTWRIFGHFQYEAWIEGHPRLAAWLRAADPVMTYELAERVARLFDQYTTYRGDWLADWLDELPVPLDADDARGIADEAWQAQLWRRLVADIGVADRDPTELFKAALAADTGAASAPDLSAMATGVHVFALSTIPPLHLSLLQSLSQRIDVHMYAVNPCHEYWFDLVDEKRSASLKARNRHAHHETAHALLTGWGRQAQSQLGQLVDVGSDAALCAVETHEQFIDPDGDSLLASVQRSILNLQPLDAGSVLLRADDQSIQVHVCHSLTREIEVLHDRLLAAFSASGEAPPLRPEEVLVVTPDLEAAAPLVDAVFGAAPRERAIPYAITGRARSAVNPAARALLDTLALLDSRFEASAVMSLLEQPMVAARFSLDAAGLAQVHDWLKAGGVHWALDAQHRASTGLPALATHSFADGLDRLFLGYALPDQVTQPFGDLMPAGGAEGSDALALGALSAFIATLTGLRARFSGARAALAWPTLLAEALDAIVLADADQVDDLGEVREALADLGDELTRSDTSARLPLDVVRVALTRLLDEAARGGVPTGAVTFSAIASLRHLPYRMICVLGLNDGAFPSSLRIDELDLMARKPRPGDRQRRLDERNLMLDLLMAASERLYLSHVGRSVRDNSFLPPSILVSQLLEFVTPALAVPSDASSPIGQRTDDAVAVRAHLVVEHPLQAFSPLAFHRGSDVRLRSFRDDYASALRERSARTLALSSMTTDTVPEATGDSDGESGPDEADDEGASIGRASAFFPAPLDAPGDEWREVSIDDLVRFFRHPACYLLQRRLGLTLLRAEDELQDDEPFLLDFEGHARLVDALLPPLLAGERMETVQAMALADAYLPVGALGRQLLQRELTGLDRFVQWVAAARLDPPLEPHAVSVVLPVDGNPWHLTASFPDPRPGGLVRFRYAALHANDYLEGWLHHLLLCASPPPGVEAVTRVIGADGHFSLMRCDTAHQVLTDLLALYARGLTEPLPFFPKSAWAYFKKGEDLRAAVAAWQVTEYAAYGEGGDAANRLLWRGRPDPVVDDSRAFVACAEAVFGPLLAHLVVAQE